MTAMWNHNLELAMSLTVEHFSATCLDSLLNLEYLC